MPPPLLNHVSTTSLPQHCEPSSPFLASVSSSLSICLPTPLALVSSLLGTLSIISWLFAQLPQIFKNYQLQSTTGLSFFFLVIWCLGDGSNLVGAVLTRQAGWQVVVAAYYVFVDVILVFQFYWYTHVKGRRDSYGDSTASHNGGGPEGVLDGVSLFENDVTSKNHPPDVARTAEPMDVNIGQVHPGTLLGKSPPMPTEKHSFRQRSTTSAVERTPSALLVPTRTVLLASLLCAVLANATPTSQPHVHPPATTNPSKTNAETVGRVFSWLSTLLYLGSRPPQLYKNYRRKSTSGLSPLLFTAAFCGNFFYSTSIVTNPNAWSDFPPYGGGGWADADGNSRLEWVGRAVPFFLGAFGVLGMDGYMGVQFLMYGSTGEDTVAVVKDKGPVSSQGRWMGVRVWIGRWIPLVSPNARRASTSSTLPPESRALLDDETERYGAL